MTCLRVRQYQAQDQAAVWRLHLAALEPTGAFTGDGPWQDDLRSIPQTYTESGGEFLVGFVNDQLVAMGALKRTAEKSAEIKRMRVAPEWQRRGFGRQILVALEQRAAILGCDYLHLDTTSLQVAAHGFYKSAGYREMGKDTWQRGGLSFDLILYEKSLTQPAKSN